MALTGQSLIVTNKPAVLKQIEAFLEQLRLSTVPVFRFRTVFFEEEEGSSATGFRLLSGAEARKMYKELLAGKGGRVLFSGTTSCRIGDSTYMGDDELWYAVMDHDTVVAQKAAIAYPVVDKLLLGKGLTLQPHLSSDGKKLALFALFNWRRLPNGVEQFDPGNKKYKVQERVKIENLQSSFSLAMPMNAGLILAPGGNRQPGLRVLLLCERMDPMPQGHDGTGIYPSSLLSSAIHRALPNRERGQDRGVNLGKSAYESDQLIELIRESVEPASWDTDTVWMEAFNSYIFARNNEKALAGTARLLTYLSKNLERSFVVELVREMKARNDKAARWQIMGVPLTIGCLGGRVGFAVQGTEQTYIRDYNGEIAQNSAIGDAITGAVFEGTWMIAGVEVVGDKCMLRLAVLDQALVNLRRFSTGIDELGTLWLPELRKSEKLRSLLMTPGETRELGQGAPRKHPVLGEVQTRLSVRLTEL